MKLDKANIGKLFREGIQYSIPLFQRHYVWNKAGQWDPLWDDIKKNIAKHDGNEKISPHFTGAVVVQQKDASPGKAGTYEIIDGQQRLTTFQVILCALRDSFKSPDAVREVEKFLLNSDSMSSGLEKYKLVPTEFDKEALLSLIDSREPGGEVSRNLLIHAHKYFMDRIREFTDGDEGRLRSLLRCIREDFQFVSILLGSNDEPEMIFESLNGRGQPLLQFDLLRNNLFCVHVNLRERTGMICTRNIGGILNPTVVGMERRRWEEVKLSFQNYFCNIF